MQITLDYLDNISFDDENPPLTNAHALTYLKDGIMYLANLTKHYENKIAEDKIMSKMIFSASFGEKYEDNLIACCHHWFGMSVMNYCRLVSLIEIMEKNSWKSSDVKNNGVVIKNHILKYINNVSPAICTWRNKIAGHFAITDPHDENIATLEMSIMHPVNYSQPHYYVSAGKWCTNGEEGNIPEWSLVEEFEKLIPRYWPNIKAE